MKLHSINDKMLNNTIQKEIPKNHRNNRSKKDDQSTSFSTPCITAKIQKEYKNFVYVNAK